VPTVMIYQSPRTPTLRTAAMRRVTDALVDAYGLQPDQIQVFHEVPEDSWGRGGVLASKRAVEAAHKGER
jgi:4-oxalocrotonate tautomerase